MIIVLFYYLTVKVLGELGLYIIFGYFLIFLLKNFLGFIVSFNFNIDLVSISLVLLTLIIFILILLCIYYEFMYRNKWEFLFFLLFILFYFLTFTFFVSSFIVFYIFFEFVLIPTFIFILGWGYSLNRMQASFFIIFYTLFSSLPLLVFLLFLRRGIKRVMFYYIVFNNFSNYFFYYWWLFILLVFIVKLPLFILHVWLPKAHVDAPLLGSMVLAGVLLKLGGYGLYKVIVFIYYLFKDFLVVLNSFSIFGSLIIAFICLRQIDIKRIVAYSSVVHIGPVFSSFLFLFYGGVLGGYWIIISHGVCSVCLFYMLNIVYFWLGRRNIFIVKGGLNYIPLLSFIWFFYCMSNIGFPPTFNFFSELSIILNVFLYRKWFLILFLFLMLVRGFYRVLLFLFFNHGGLKFYFFKFYFLTLKDFHLFIFSSNILLFFFMFIYIL